MSNEVVYIEFNTLFTELYKRADDYYGDGTFMGFKTRMDSFFDNFKSEYYKNFSILTKDNKNGYIGHLKNELEKLSKIFFPGDKRYIDILSKFKIDEKGLFNHQNTVNELYQILVTDLSSLKELYKKNPENETTYDEIIDILRTFYRQYSYSYTNEMILFIEREDELIVKKSSRKVDDMKGNSKSRSFGFLKDNKDTLRKIFYELTLDSGDFINKNETTEEQFISILTSKDYNEVLGTIQFECETTQAAYIISAMQRISRGFTFKKISESKKFLSEKGTIITDSNLSKSKSESPQPKEFERIDKFFANLILKQ